MPRRALAALATILLATGLAACGSSGGSTASTSSAPAAPAITVMTRNLYLGADLMPIFKASGSELGAVLQATYQQVVDSEVESRMASVAGEIATAKPDLVALQEASLWQVQAAGAPAPTVLYDFVSLLLARLESAGEPYEVASTVDGFNGGLPVEGVGAVTMQDRDVILRRRASAVQVSNPQQSRFTSKLTLTVSGVGIEVLRGWTSVDASIEGRTVRLVGTHLEAFDDPTRDAQERELLDALAGVKGPVLVLGDLNSAAGGTGSGAYDTMVKAGFVDAAAAASPQPPLTCCRSADLRSGELSERIDFVLARGAGAVRSAAVVGTDAAERTPGGRWPSDHAGVVATIEPG